MSNFASPSTLGTFSSSELPSAGGLQPHPRGAVSFGKVAKWPLPLSFVALRRFGGGVPTGSDRSGRPHLDRWLHWPRALSISDPTVNVVLSSALRGTGLEPSCLPRINTF